MKRKNKLFCASKNKSLKIRSDLLDQDYLNKLTKEERDWLMRFQEEYVGANFKHNGKRIHPVKYTTKIVKKTGKKKKVDIYKQNCEHMNNHRNNDVLGKAKSTGCLSYKLPEKFYDVEDTLIEKIDLQNTKTEEELLEEIMLNNKKK